MPIYEYSCPACRQPFEQRRPMSDVALAIACPSCGSPSERKLSAFAVSRGGFDEPLPMATGGGGGGCCGGGGCACGN